MSETWYAAFGLLAILTVANSVLLVATMRQVGVLHQRVPPTGPGSVGPQPGQTFEHLATSLVPGSTSDGLGTAPLTVIAYVTPGCALCERIPGFIEAVTRSAAPHERGLLSFALATDAPAPEAQEYRDRHDLQLPLVCHPDFADHYEVKGIGAPYLLALADLDGNGGEKRQILLAGGIVNSLEQLEDLVDMARGQYWAYLGSDGDDNVAVYFDGASDAAERLTVIGGGRGDDRPNTE